MVVHTQGPQSNKSSKSGIGKRASEVGGLRKAGKSSSSRARDGTSQAFWYLLLPLLVAAAAAIAGAIYLQPVRHPVTLRPNARSRSPHHDDKERAAAEQAAADLAAVKKAAANKAAKQAAAERAAVQKVAAEEAAADLAAAEKAAAAKVSAELAEAERAEAALAAAEHTKAAEEPTKAAAAAAGSARPAAHAPPPVSRPAARPPPRIIKTASENAAAERSAEAAAEWSANAAAAWSSKAAARAPSLVDDIGGATVRSVLAALLPTCDTSAKAGASAFLNAFLTGNDLKHARKYTDALSCYKLALSLQQDTEQQASVYNNLGNTIRRATPESLNCGEETCNSWQLHDAAVFCLRHVIALNPKHANAHVNLATILFERGQLSEAVEMLKTAIVIDPWHSVAVKRLAEVEKAMDEDEPGFDDGDDGD